MSQRRQSTDSPRDWRRTNHDGENLADVNLSGYDLRNAQFVGATLKGADLRGTSLQGCDFGRAKLSGVRLSGARTGEGILDLLRDEDQGPTMFVGSDLTDATLRYAILANASFENAILRRADFRGANLANVTFKGAELEQADLRGCVGLTCAQLFKAKNWQSAYRDAELFCGVQSPRRSNTETSSSKTDGERSDALKRLGVLEKSLLTFRYELTKAVPTSEGSVSRQHNQPPSDELSDALEIIDHALETAEYIEKVIDQPRLELGGVEDATGQLRSASKIFREKFTEKFAEKLGGYAAIALVGVVMAAFTGVTDALFHLALAFF